MSVAAGIASPPQHVLLRSVLALAYLGAVSMCLGFFAWYQALARGGVARIGRLQLAQPALTLGWSALLLGEHVSLLTGAAAVAVIAVTAVGRNARVDRPAEPPRPAELCAVPAALKPALADLRQLPADVDVAVADGGAAGDLGPHVHAARPG